MSSTRSRVSRSRAGSRSREPEALIFPSPLVLHASAQVSGRGSGAECQAPDTPLPSYSELYDAVGLLRHGQSASVDIPNEDDLPGDGECIDEPVTDRTILSKREETAKPVYDQIIREANTEGRRQLLHLDAHGRDTTQWFWKLFCNDYNENRWTKYDGGWTWDDFAKEPYVKGVKADTRGLLSGNGEGRRSDATPTASDRQGATAGQRAQLVRMMGIQGNDIVRLLQPGMEARPDGRGDIVIRPMRSSKLQHRSHASSRNGWLDFFVT